MGCNCGKISYVAPTYSVPVAGAPSVISPLQDTTSEVVSAAVLPEVTATAPTPTATGIVRNSNYNILDVMKDKISGNLRYVDDGLRESRLHLCKSCEHLVAGLCGKCGCVVEFKVRYEQSSCVIGKW